MKEEDMADIISSTALERFGIANLYPQQRLVISNILAGAGYFGVEDELEAPKKQLVLLPTGMGKSICFMLPCILIRPLTVVLFPLLSLMKDQERRFAEAGIESVLFQGGQSRDERKKLFRNIEEGRARVVLINPELLAQPAMAEALAAFAPLHLVLDEVHTLPEWGETFRPAYLETGAFAARREVAQITAFTATAGKRIVGKVKQLLFAGEEPLIISELPDRPNIHYQVLPVLSRNWTLVELLAPGPEALPRPAIVFCRTRRETEECASFLRFALKEQEICFFHAGLERDEKEAIAEWFFHSQEGILAATTAYGMGVDKKNVRTVIHHKPAPSVEAFLQESGRAGRDRKASRSVVLVAPEDLPRPDSDVRYRDLMECFLSTKECRRKALLKLLDAEIDSCSGCDVCENKVQSSPPYLSSLLTWFRRYRFRYTLGEAAELAARYCFKENREASRAVLDGMLRAGIIRMVKRGPWKGLLGPVKRKQK